MIALKPLPGRVLVELERYEGVVVTDGKYDSYTHGICLLYCYTHSNNDGFTLKEAKTMFDGLVGRTLFWQQFKEGEIIERDGKKYTFVKIEDIDGYEDDKS